MGELPHGHSTQQSRTPRDLHFPCRPARLNTRHRVPLLLQYPHIMPSSTPRLPRFFRAAATPPCMMHLLWSMALPSAKRRSRPTTAFASPSSLHPPKAMHVCILAPRHHHHVHNHWRRACSHCLGCSDSLSDPHRPITMNAKETPTGALHLALRTQHSLGTSLGVRRFAPPPPPPTSSPRQLLASTDDRCTPVPFRGDATDPIAPTEERTLFSYFPHPPPQTT